MPVKDGKLFCTNDGPDESRAWTCRLSGKEDLIFSEAVKSEEKYRQILMENFPLEFEASTLTSIHHSRLDLDKLAERCVKRTERMECKDAVFRRTGEYLFSIISQN